MSDAPQLTEAGMLWAVANVADSQVARVALMGDVSGWPPQHVAIAVRTANSEGRMA